MYHLERCLRWDWEISGSYLFIHHLPPSCYSSSLTVSLSSFIQTAGLLEGETQESLGMSLDQSCFWFCCAIPSVHPHTLICVHIYCTSTCWRNQTWENYKACALLYSDHGILRRLINWLYQLCFVTSWLTSFVWYVSYCILSQNDSIWLTWQMTNHRAFLEICWEVQGYLEPLTVSQKTL